MYKLIGNKCVVRKAFEIAYLNMAFKITLSGSFLSVHATLKMCLSSSANPILAPLLADRYIRGKPSLLDNSDARYNNRRHLYARTQTSHVIVRTERKICKSRQFEETYV